MTSEKFWNFEPHSSPLYTFSRNLSYWAPLLNPSLQDFLPPFEYRRHKWKLPFLLPSWIFFLFLPFPFRFRSRARSSFHRSVAKVLKAPRCRWAPYHVGATSNMSTFSISALLDRYIQYSDFRHSATRLYGPLLSSQKI